MTLVPIALAQLRPRKGDYAANLARLGELFAQLDALEPRPVVLQLPETALTGYFLEGGVREHAMTAGALAADLNATYLRAVRAPRPLDVAIGFYELFNHTLHNSMMYVRLGVADGDGGTARHGWRIEHVHRKNFLPTYGLFDEERFVERGLGIASFGWHPERPRGRAAMLVCEDAWHSISGTLAALDGAEIIFLGSAAPGRGAWPRSDGIEGPASAARWERLVRDIAEEHGVYVVYSNMVGSEGGKMFFGGSMVVGPKGDVRARAPMWEEALVVTSIDIEDVHRARADMPLLADLRTAMPHIQIELERIREGVRPVVAWDEGCSREGRGARGEGRVGRERSADGGASAPDGGDGAGAAHGRAPFPVIAVDRHHGGPPPLELDPALATEWLVRFLREELAQRGFSRAVIGVSGGVDSAVTAALAARALGGKNVIGVRLPYKTSSPDSLAHAQLVIDTLGIESRTIDISAAVDGYLANEPDAEPGRRGNVMARMRMIALFDLSAKHRAIPLGTGNKTERLLGYFTWHADDSPPVNPLGDLFKTQVWTLARHLGIPAVVVDKPPTADLIVGQTDEGDFGISYARADEILNWLVSGYTDVELVDRGFGAEEVALVHKRLSGTHWKRRLPTVAMVSGTAIGESYLRPVDY